jgi:cytochrome c oxidase assembly protein subunit 15
MFVLQAALGISTLLLSVPIPLAAAHQAGAVLLLACALWNAQANRTSTPSTANIAAAMR